MSKYTEDQYPVVLSKQDPLIVRVDDLMLVVGTTAYSAKIKIGTLYAGFYIHTNGIGEPIAKISVNVKDYSLQRVDNDPTTSDAYKYVAEQAATWMDNLERSFTESTDTKNLVEVIQEVIEGEGTDNAQIRIDKNDEAVVEAINSVAESTSDKLQDIVDKLDNIDTNLSSIVSALGTGNSTFAKLIADAITNGLQTLTSEMSTMNTNINTVSTNMGAFESGTTLKSMITGVQTSVDDVPTNSEMTNLISGTGGNSVKSMINAQTTDIEQAISSSGGSSGQAISGVSQQVTNLANTVNGMNTTVNTINNNTTTTKNNVNSLSQAVYSEDSSALHWNNTMGWIARTELTEDDLITGPDNDKRVKADTN